MRIVSISAIGLVSVALTAAACSLPDRDHFFVRDGAADVGGSRDASIDVPSDHAGDVTTVLGDIVDVRGDDVENDAMDVVVPVEAAVDASDPCTGAGCAWVQIVAGDGFTCARRLNGEVDCWGANDVGQCGQTGVSTVLHPRPVALANAATDLAAGARHACALVAGRAFCWGDNSSGQLGDTTTVSTPVPTSVASVARGSAWTVISAGRDHTCGVRDTGDGFCWGDNSSGQLGDGTMTGSTRPTPVSDSIAWESIAAGAQFTCGLQSSVHSVFCWGANSDGQSGQVSPTPVLVPGPIQIAGSKAIGVGRRDGYALSANGSMNGSCWGALDMGQCGANNTAGSTYDPIPVANVLNSVQFARSGGSGEHMCVIDASRAVTCWGQNDVGQCGPLTNLNRAPPTAVPLGAVDDVAVGQLHTCAVVNPSVWCWGDDSFGQLGDGGGASRSSPMPVTF